MGQFSATLEVKIYFLFSVLSGIFPNKSFYNHLQMAIISNFTNTLLNYVAIKSMIALMIGMLSEWISIVKEVATYYNGSCM